MKYLPGLLIAVFAAALFALAIFAEPAKAQTCVTVAADKAAVEAKGFKWLGIEDVPFTEGIEYVYYERDGGVFFSPVFNGCVVPQAYPLGPFVPGVSA